MTRMENDHPWFTFGAVMYLEMKAIMSGAKIVQKGPGVLAKGGIKGTTIFSPRLGRIAKRGALSLAETLKNMSKREFKGIYFIIFLLLILGIYINS